MNIIKPMKSIVSISALCVVMAFSGAASANISGSDAVFDSSSHYKSSKHMMKRMIKTLSLSEQQQVQIKAIKTQAKEQSKTLRETMKQFKEEEKLLLQAATFDESAYTALQTSYQPTFAQIALTRAKTKHAIFNVLTTEQQEKWQQVKEKRRARSKKN